MVDSCVVLVETEPVDIVTVVVSISAGVGVVVLEVGLEVVLEVVLSENGKIGNKVWAGEFFKYPERERWSMQQTITGVRQDRNIRKFTARVLLRGTEHSPAG